MEKTYNPHTIEKHWYQQWEKNNYFAPQGQSNTYCIMLPPPNVTGSLHMGHGFGSTLMDILIRYHRMLGDNTLWQAGTDHAGIATQMVVERQLLAEGKSRHTLGREAFVEKVWQWKETSGNRISQQLRRLGASLDWQRERFTMDESLSAAVREVFIRLYDEGLIYRGLRLVNWDPQLLTAISDLEVINQEEEGKLWHIRYPLADHSGHLIVATTRPETLLGDVAVAVHPDDERYKNFIGKFISLPLTNRRIPIIADSYVDPLFGSGCVKITPAHDFNDYAVGTRHGLIPVNIFTPNAQINENAPPAYQGMDRFEAREQIVKDLQTAELIEKIEKHKLNIPRGDRSGVIVEPYLTYQWFVKTAPLAAPAIRAVESGKIRFIPENWDKTYFQWMNNIEDWCISRQLWWGHRIPVWYDDEGKPYVGQNEADVRERYKLSADITLQQDNDVLDTWFSSALWPFSTLGWPQQTPELKTFLPTNVLVTGFDIIFFWVARMIMMSLKFTGQIPFREVYITGLIRDAEGQKMSKTKGNVLDPLDLIDGITLEELVNKRTMGLMQPAMAEKITKNTRHEYPEGIPSFGTDALRFTYAAMASYTREIRFDINRLAGNRNFCNKLWNAARYVLMNADPSLRTKQCHPDALSLPDRWILSRLQKTIADAHQTLQQYRFDLFAQNLYEFTWNEFCDWYLELSKPILISTESTADQLQATRHTLVTVLEQLLRLLHPVMPFITEEIWQTIVGGEGNSIMLQAYPRVDKQFIHSEIEAELEWVKQVVVAIRTVRSEMNVAPGKLIQVLWRKGNKLDKERVTKHALLMSALTKLQGAAWLDEKQTPPESATAIIGELEVFIPLEGLINKAEEMARLEREIGKLHKDIQLITGKLGNKNFVDKAPAEVVGKEQKRLEELTATRGKLEQQLAAMRG